MCVPWSQCFCCRNISGYGLYLSSGRHVSSYNYTRSGPVESSKERVTESRVCPRPYVSPCRDIENFREGVIRIFRIAIVSDEACIYSEVARSLFFLSDISNSLLRVTSLKLLGCYIMNSKPGLRITILYGYNLSFSLLLLDKYISWESMLTGRQVLLSRVSETYRV